ARGQAAHDRRGAVARPSHSAGRSLRGGNRLLNSTPAEFFTPRMTGRPAVFFPQTPSCSRGVLVTFRAPTARDYREPFTSSPVLCVEGQDEARSPSEDRRAAARHSSRARASRRVAGNNESEAWDASIHDVSTLGIGLLLPCAVPPSTVLDIKL